MVFIILGEPERYQLRLTSIIDIGPNSKMRATAHKEKLHSNISGSNELPYKKSIPIRSSSRKVFARTEAYLNTSCKPRMWLDLS